MSEYHIPVLLRQSVDALMTKPDSLVVDVTFGAGGHSKLILKNIGAKGHLYAFDQDIDALNNVLDHPQFTLFHSNYRYLKKYLRVVGVDKVDAILADLGISSYQIDEPERGFSFRYDAPLDMRMNGQQQLSAADIINTYSEEELVEILSAYGEVRNAKSLSKAIIKARTYRRVSTTYDFNKILDATKMGPAAKYFAQVYQAIRIEVNDEMNGLISFLEQAKEVLAPGGRIAIISYHSLEDRLVKNLFKTGNVAGEMIKDEYGNIDRPFTIINKSVIVADAEEQRSNPRSRSAKLRIAEKR